jgi:hypothetical protein
LRPQLQPTHISAHSFFAFFTSLVGNAAATSASSLDHAMQHAVPLMWPASAAPDDVLQRRMLPSQHAAAATAELGLKPNEDRDVCCTMNKTNENQWKSGIHGNPALPYALQKSMRHY